nr:MAG: hypothetical protein 3 [Leviviridae sp.]
MSLWSCTADELAVRCHTSAIRDQTTVANRIEHEGLSFLAITLASFGKAVEKWLDQGFVVPSDASSFKRGKGHRNGLPAFLSGFLARVFDPVSGVLYHEPDIEAIYAIRQLTLMFSKIALPSESREGSQNASHGSRRVVSEARERRAMSDFLICEQDVKAADARLDFQYMEDFKRVSAMLFGDLFAKVDRDIHWGRLTPKHGPGATAERLTANGKYNQRTWPARLELEFPFEMNAIPNPHFRGDKECRFDTLEPGAEIPVRVITVPKTLKAPRVIAIEPSAMQYAQQAILGGILSAFREDGFLSRAVGFADQNPNREMALEGSLSGELATLDLSEASDRVSNEHVLALLEDFPHLSAAVQASRSRKAHVPGHGVIRLAKFASMGSALCFPMEAMVFLTVIFMGIERESSAPFCDRDSMEEFDRRVRVFGDDLIVPRDYVLSVVSELENFGFRVNASKSFWTGKYRESCGREYYHGHDVSIVKVREVFPTRRHNADGVESAVAFRNLAYWAGLWKTADWMDTYIGKLLKEYPNVAPSSPLLGRQSALGYQFQKLDKETHGPLTKGYFVSSRAPEDKLQGPGALLKCLLRNQPSLAGFGIDGRHSHSDYVLPNVDNEHLERYGRPKHVDIKLGWRSPF